MNYKKNYTEKKSKDSLVNQINIEKILINN